MATLQRKHLLAWLAFICLAGGILVLLATTNETVREEITASTTRLDAPPVSLSVAQLLTDDRGRATSTTFQVTNEAGGPARISYRVELKDNREQVLFTMPGNFEVPAHAQHSLAVTLPPRDEWDMLQVTMVDGPQEVFIRRGTLETASGESTYAP